MLKKLVRFTVASLIVGGCSTAFVAFLVTDSVLMLLLAGVLGGMWLFGVVDTD